MWRNRVPAGHTAPLGPRERDIPNQVGFDPREGNSSTLGYGSHLPQPATSGGARKWQEKMKTKYNCSSCKVERRGGGN